MDIYELSQEYLQRFAPLNQWPEMQALLKKATLVKAPFWQLPQIGCEAVGGRPSQAIPAVAAIACAQISIILVDDMLDDDPRGEFHRLGQPAAANLAVAFQAAGLAAVADSEAPEATKLAVLQSLNKMMGQTAYGQHLDVQNAADEAAYWRVVRAKSSPFFAAALEIGALFGGGAAETAARFHQMGSLYGEIIQIHDDLSDTMASPANPDWTTGRSPLPILFAQEVNHPQRERFLALRQALPDPQALVESQTILLRCGAVSYCVQQLLGRCQQLQMLIQTTPMAERGGLEALVAAVMRPIQTLFTAAGIAQPVATVAAISSSAASSALSPSLVA